MTGFRRPFPAPNVLAHVERAEAVMPRLKGPNSEEIKEVIRALKAFALTQGDFNRSLFDQTESLPGKHGETHVGDDPIPLDSAVGLGNANEEGDDRSLARSDHVHKRDVRVAYNGTDVGTRNRLNFISTGGAWAAPTDDPGSDEIDIPLPVVTGILAYYGL